METPTSAQIRRQLDEDIYSGAYKRPEGQLEVQECFKGSDMRQVSSDYGITAAYTEQGSHWRLILSFQRVAEGYQALVYDPLVGVTNMTIRPERGIEHLVLSPELDRLRIKRYNERGVVSRDRNGFPSYMSDIDFLEEYFRKNPTPRDIIDILHRRGRTQNDSYNCGPLTIAAAYAINEYSRGKLGLKELETIIIEDPDGDIRIKGLDEDRPGPDEYIRIEGLDEDPYEDIRIEGLDEPSRIKRDLNGNLARLKKNLER